MFSISTGSLIAGFGFGLEIGRITRYCESSSLEKTVSSYEKDLIQDELKTTRGN